MTDSRDRLVAEGAGLHWLMQLLRYHQDTSPEMATEAPPGWIGGTPAGARVRYYENGEEVVPDLHDSPLEVRMADAMAAASLGPLPEEDHEPNTVTGTIHFGPEILDGWALDVPDDRSELENAVGTTSGWPAMFSPRYFAGDLPDDEGPPPGWTRYRVALVPLEES